MSNVSDKRKMVENIPCLSEGGNSAELLGTALPKLA